MRDERDGACSAAVVDASGSCGIDSTKAVCRCVGSYLILSCGGTYYVVSVLMLPAGLGVAWSGCVCVVLFCFRLGVFMLTFTARLFSHFHRHTRWVGVGLISSAAQKHYDDISYARPDHSHGAQRPFLRGPQGCIAGCCCHWDTGCTIVCRGGTTVSGGGWWPEWNGSSSHK